VIKSWNLDCFCNMNIGWNIHRCSYQNHCRNLDPCCISIAAEIFIEVDIWITAEIFITPDMRIIV
jgi:hypothetical protein